MLAIGGILTGCTNSAISSGFDPVRLVGRDPTLPPIHSATGAYLSGRVAEQADQDHVATAYYAAALSHAPDDPLIAERLVAVAVADGRMDIADKTARHVAAAISGAPLSELVLAVANLAANDPAEAVVHAAKIPPIGFYRIAGTLARAWTIAATGPSATSRKSGDPGAAKTAIAALSELGDNAVVAPLRLVHTAMIEDLAGNVAAASADYRQALAPGRPPLRLVQLAGNFFERTGQTAQAAALYQDYRASEQGGFGFTPILSKTPPAPIIASAKDGLAEGLFDVASIMNRAGANEGTMIGVRLSLRLRPDLPLAKIILGDALYAQHRPEEALVAYRSIDPHSPLGWAAELGEAQLLITEKRWQDANGLLLKMVAARPQQIVPLESLGDVARFQQKYAEAITWYDRALDKLGSGGDPAQRQILYFNRGIAYERAGRWPEAQADLRLSLTLRPDDPQVANYLGYAMIDRGDNLREGLSLVQQAAAHAPDDGYIVDSLGWAYYKLKDYPKATSTLERAIELKPADPEITSHLGDAYWGGRRHDEARLEWRRALELKPDAALAQSIAMKLQDASVPSPLHSRRKE